MSSTYSAEILKLGEKAVSAGLVDPTKQAYGAGLLRWNQFCDNMSIPEHRRMPADETLIVAFIGFHMGKVSGSCIKNWLSGLSAWDDMAGAPWPSNSRLIRFARTGAKTAGAAHKRARRNPITLAHMLALHANLNYSIPFHCSVWAVACVAFWGCRRLGELTIPSKQGFDPKKHASRCSTIRTSYNSDNSRKAMSFEIPWTKTTKELGATVVATAQSNSLKLFCPCIAIERHMLANVKVPRECFLFAYLDKQGAPQNMVKSSFLEFCERIWMSVGLEKVQGHSFRIGGAVELLLAGVTPEVVAALGGWTSLAFLLYWRRYEDIIPTHILKAYDISQNPLVNAGISGIDIIND